MDAANEALGTLISGRQRKDGKHWKTAYEYMQVYLQRLGLDDRIGELSIIHVAGTKGKGSTCAMVESILRSCGYRTGLFTSPHLWTVRERIQINGRPVTEDVYLRAFWQCYRRLEDQADEMVGKAAYFRFLTLLGLHIFLEERVDVAILEVGLGGRLDATNVVRTPAVCGIASLGFDHMEVLGHTLPEIAAEKAGIFKRGASALTVRQRPDAMQTLVAKAAEAGAPLSLAPLLAEYEGGAAKRVAAVAARRLPEEYLRGLAACQWPGRAQVVHVHQACGNPSDPDGGACAPPCNGHAAHEPNLGAAEAGGCGTRRGEVQRVLLFNCMPERDPRRLLQPLTATLAARGLALPLALFVPADSSYAKLAPSAGPPDLSWQVALQQVWEADFAPAARLQAAGATLPPLPRRAALAAQDAARGAVAPSLHSAVEWLRGCVRQRPGLRMQVLVTGSLYLVGDILRHLGRPPF
ncbi:hypothetical protein WJX81_000787 [Elliptochloris bilobata]|uniref:tetrahydrofolate synthase n=1 Tax=Elliptochloris bilobata TaxID=381761 RepID=A0AAW1RMV0_9CHLO